MKFIILMTVSIILSCSMVLGAQNDTGDTTVTIVSAVPSILTIELNDATLSDNSITLTAAAKTNLTCNGTANDTDGLGDITAISAVIWGPSSTYGGADSDDDHYTNSSCTYIQATGAFGCRFDSVEFYAEIGNWTCNVSVTDIANNTNTSEDDAIIQTLLAIDIPDATNIDFGSVAISGISSEQSVTFENEGNVEIDVDLDFYRDNDTINDASAMNCTNGTIPVGNINATIIDLFGPILSEILPNNSAPIIAATAIRANT